MSGGSYDYGYVKIEDLAGQIRANATGPCRALRLAFADLLLRCATACHDIEWVDSCDKSPGAEAAALDAVLTPALVLAAERAALEAAIVVATDTLARLRTAEAAAVGPTP